MLANRPVPKENQTPAVSFYKLLAQSQAVNLSAPRLDPTPSGRTPESEAMSKDLKGKGFRFVGPTICYAHMQAVGMINDHLVSCFRHREIGKMEI